jgi:hypothetical protein
MGTMTRRPTKLMRKKKAIVRASVGSLMLASVMVAVLVFSAVFRSIASRYDPNPPDHAHASPAAGSTLQRR